MDNRKRSDGPLAAYAVETRFSTKGLTADHLIERLIVEVREMTDDYLPITVVTSDRLIHALAMRERAAVTGSRDFIRELDALRAETSRYAAQIPFRVTLTEVARSARKKRKPTLRSCTQCKTRGQSRSRSPPLARNGEGREMRFYAPTALRKSERM